VSAPTAVRRASAQRAHVRGALIAAGLLRAARPRQWPKNLLVFAAVAASPSQASGPVLGRVALCLVAFVLASAGVYLINDVRDVEQDRRHWRKQTRPIAAGLVPIPVALTAAAVSLLLALTAAALTGGRVALVVAGYIALCLAYSARLKRVPVLELVVLAAGFYLRTLAGSVAGGIPLSHWFTSVVCAGALFLAVSKREAELRELGAAAAGHRAVLGRYRVRTLRAARLVAAVAAIALYAGWAATRPGVVTPTLALVSTVPLIVGLIFYSRRVDAGQGDAPEELLLRARPLQLAVLAWAVAFSVAVFSG
jgi:decaprenyl-phosphate phosphoribosyltransferase